MRSTLLDWEAELARWLKPFLDRLGHKARRRMCPLYVTGLIGPGDRKSIQPMAERLVLGNYDQLHHLSSLPFKIDTTWTAILDAGQQQDNGSSIPEQSPC